MSAANQPGAAQPATNPAAARAAAVAKAPPPPPAQAAKPPAAKPAAQSQARGGGSLAPATLPAGQVQPAQVSGAPGKIAPVAAQADIPFGSPEQQAAEQAAAQQAKASAEDALADLIPGQGREIIYPPFEELTMLVYGDQGSGKTSFFGSSGESFILAFEPGAQFQKAAMRRIERWAPDPKGLDKRLDFITVGRAIAASAANGSLRSKGVKIVVCDTIDRMHALCSAWVCETNGVAQIGDIPFGKGYAIVTDTLKKALLTMSAYIPVACISHAITATEELEGMNGVKAEVEKRKPSVDRRIAEWLAGEQSLVGYTYKTTEGKFAIKFHSDPRLETKDRTSLFEGRRKVLPLDWAQVKAAYTAAATERKIVLRSRFAPIAPKT